jgi:hypothetical protein
VGATPTRSTNVVRRIVIGVDVGVGRDSDKAELRLFCSICMRWRTHKSLVKAERPRLNQGMEPALAYVCRDVCLALARLAWRHSPNSTL